jgi:predicted nucleic acid-binding protein
MIVVDSSVWIGHFRDRDIEPVRKLRGLRNPDQVIVGDLILVEVLQGARDDRHAAQLERVLRAFKIEAMLSDELAVRAARNYRTLRSQGITVRTTIDLIIATFCAEYGHSLLHDDRDFTPLASWLSIPVV